MRADDAVSDRERGRARNAARNATRAAAPVASAGDPGVRRWLQGTLAADPPRAKSLIVTVWGDSLVPHGSATWLAGLIRLMLPFGVNERLVRTSVYRLVRDGWLVGASHGRASRYRLTADGARRFDEAHARIYARPADNWRGEWELVLADEVAAARRGALRDELAWAGFGALGPTTFVRPHEPARALPAVLGVSGIAQRAIAVRAAALPPARPLDDVLRTAWDVAGLAARYRRFLARFGTAIDRFRDEDAASAEQCFAARTLLIHGYRRVLLRDPLLPAALLPPDWPGTAAHALCRDFYRLTQRRAELHLATVLAARGTGFAPASVAFHARFGGL